jgi:hypothetical protein
VRSASWPATLAMSSSAVMACRILRTNSSIHEPSRQRARAGRPLPRGRPSAARRTGPGLQKVGRGPSSSLALWRSCPGAASMAHAAARPDQGRAGRPRERWAGEHSTHDRPVLHALKGGHTTTKRGTGARDASACAAVAPSPSGPRPQRASPLTLMGVAAGHKPRAAVQVPVYAYVTEQSGIKRRQRIFV